MPFDGTIQEDPRLKYQIRREQAIELWKTIPKEQFNIESYFQSCGTIACAIGWLAYKEHDGWTLKVMQHPKGDYDLPFYSKTKIQIHPHPSMAGTVLNNQIARYFGITRDEAKQLFTAFALFETFYDKHPSKITLEDVIEKLSFTCITVYEEENVNAV